MQQVTMAKQVKLAPETPMPCPEPGCNGTLRRRRSPRFNPWWYACDQWGKTGCKGSIGCHPNGTPLGIPASTETKQWRIKAHAAFDPLWKQLGMKRGQAYAWLQKRLGVEWHVHIAASDEDMCRRIINLCDAKRAELEAT